VAAAPAKAKSRSAAAVLTFFIAGLLYLLRFERVDNLGAYAIAAVTRRTHACCIGLAVRIGHRPQKLTSGRPADLLGLERRIHWNAHIGL